MKLVIAEHEYINIYLPPYILNLLSYRTYNCPECNLGKLYPFPANNLIRYEETNSEYKHLVNSRFELFRKQDRIFVSCFLNNSNLEFARCLYLEFVSSCKLYIIKAYGS